MRRSNCLSLGTLALWVIFSFLYYNIFHLMPTYKHKSKIIQREKTLKTTSTKKLYKEYFNETGFFLLSTPGCVIPNYAKKMVYKSGNARPASCPRRSVFIDAVSENEIVFTIKGDIVNYRKKNKPYNCCYEIVSRASSSKPGVNDTQVTRSPCVTFHNGTKAKLIEEFIYVKCSYIDNNTLHIFYSDSYIMIKKNHKCGVEEQDAKWNILLLGIDTMSRARARHSWPLTTKFFKTAGWLDYKAYNKVGGNTYPNLMALLAGDAKLACGKPSMDINNHLLLWSKYKNAGYVTAYGEDNLKIPDTFSRCGGFEVPPTDHYMRPFFLLGEHATGGKVCAKRMSTAVHILDYVHQFTRAYKNENFFGLFWINSYSHDPVYKPKPADKYLSTFFHKLTGDIGKNTFIFFLSDHGVRFGETRYSVESFYEERLPMLYVWVPQKFREQYTSEYFNMQVNQRRLVSTYDLHATLWNILKKSNDTVNVIKSKSCPKCTSLFKTKSKNRTCADALIDSQWCSCHTLFRIDNKKPEAQNVALTALFALRNFTSKIKTKKCTHCLRLGLKYLLRVHSYYDTYDQKSNKKHYLVAFLTFPGSAGFEVVVDKEVLGYKVRTNFSTITPYNTRGNCVVYREHRGYCICAQTPHCRKKKKSVRIE